MRRASKLPDHFAQVKAALTDVRAVLAWLGLLDGALRVGPNAYKVFCPWHNEHTPSCSVRSQDGRPMQVHCFGCGETGDVLNLIATVHRLDLRRDAQTILSMGAGQAGVTLDFGHAGVVGAGPIYQAPTARPAPVRRAGPSLDDVDAAVRALLWLSPLDGSVGVGLATRGLLAEAQDDEWGELQVDLTSAPHNGFDEHDPAGTEAAATLRASPYAATLAPVLGRPDLSPPRGGFLSPRHRLLIPWRNQAGKVWMLQRRFAPVYGDEQPGPHDGGKYRQEVCADVEPTPYGIERFHEGAAEVWLVEGAADVLAVRALCRRGLLGACAPLVALGLPGVGSWERYRASILPLLSGRTLVVATDTDAAGERVVETIAADAYRAGAADVQRERVADGVKDWSEVTRNLWVAKELP